MGGHVWWVKDISVECECLKVFTRFWALEGRHGLKARVDFFLHSLEARSSVAVVYKEAHRLVNVFQQSGKNPMHPVSRAPQVNAVLLFPKIQLTTEDQTSHPRVKKSKKNAP